MISLYARYFTLWIEWTKRIVVPRRLNPRRKARRTNQTGQRSEDIIKKKVSSSRTIALPGQTIGWFHHLLCLCNDIESGWFPVHALTRPFLKRIICACFDACFGRCAFAVCIRTIKRIRPCFNPCSFYVYWNHSGRDVLCQRYRYINVFKLFLR